MDIGLLILVFISYIRLSDVLIQYHGLPSIAQPFIGLLLVAIIFQWIFFRRPSKGWVRAALLVGAYGIIVFTSLLYAANFDKAANAVSDFLKDGIITVLIVLLLQSGPLFRKVIWALVLAGAFLGAISLIQYLTGSYDNLYFGFAQAPYLNIAGETSGNRLSGPIGDPNFYAQIMVVLVPLAFFRMMDEKNLLLKILAAFSLGLISLTVMLTFSRGAFIALGLVAVFYLFYRKPRFVELLLLLVVMIIIVQFIPTTYLERISSITDIFQGKQASTDVSFRGRTSELTAAWNMFVDHPLFGVGVQNYSVFYQQYSRRIGLDPRIEARDPHNLYLQVAAETGISGMLVFGIVLWTIFRCINDSWNLLRKAGEKEYADMVFSFGLCLVGYLSAALFIHAAYPRYFWLLTGIALAIPQVVEKILGEHSKSARA
jgi:putative inorganic carbon (hco3(-)) transporter